MAKTKSWAILLVLICTLFTATGQILYKIAAPKISLNLLSLITNVPLILGIVSYLIGAVLLIIALKNGELSVIYPLISTGFIWVSLLAVKFLDEHMSFQKWLGIAVLFAGISMIGIGSTNKRKN